MNKYLNKKIEVCEKAFEASSNVKKTNRLVGIITNIYDNKFIELDNKILIALDYIYKMEIVD